MKTEKSPFKGCLCQSVTSVANGRNHKLPATGIGYSFDGQKEFVWLDEGMNTLSDNYPCKVNFEESHQLDLNTINGIHVVSHEGTDWRSRSEMLAAGLIVELLRRASKAIYIDASRSEYSEFIEVYQHSVRVWIEGIECDQLLLRLIRGIGKQLDVKAEPRLRLCLIDGRKSYGTEITVKSISVKSISY